MPIKTQFVSPPPDIADYVDSFWSLANTDEDKEIVLIPDGKIDLFLSRTLTEGFHTTLLGISTQPEKVILAASTEIFAISLRLPAAEYILHQSIAHIINTGQQLPQGYWNLHEQDLNNFDTFCHKATQAVQARIPDDPDPRKLLLFRELYTSNGSQSVSTLSEKASWTSRQINRYFQDRFGLPLKAYSGILRFRAAFNDIKQGKLFPDSSFADQAHFIRETKKLAGVIPKVLHRNENDRFIQFSTLPEK